MSQRTMAHPREKFVTFWIGERLFPFGNMCINSFGNHGFPVDLYTHGPIADAPAFVTICDAETILPRERLFIAHGGVETSTEMFAYRYLQNVGGWVVDNDVVCNRDTVPDVEIAFAEERVGIINNAVLKFPSQHPAIDALIAYVETIDPATAPWGATGPLALTKVFREHPELAKWELKIADAYPLHWKEAPKLLFPEYTAEVIAKTAMSPFIHLWGSTLREIQFDPWRHRPIRGSFLAGLYEKHLDANLYDRLEEMDERAYRRSVQDYIAREWNVTMPLV